jgi:type III pantothenate kinase
MVSVKERQKNVLYVGDIGNTHTVLGLYKGTILLEKWRLRTDPERTTNEWGLAFKNLFDLSEIEINQVSAAIISSVVPPAVHALVRACKQYFNTSPIVIGPGTKTGLPIRYENPREVGADRVVNAVAAFARVQTSCIVIDFGTATTFDCISKKGEYLGGAICPGIGISLEALVSRTAKLPRVEIAKPRHAIGRNTVESMQSGILYGYVSLVNGLVKRLSSEMGSDVTTIATGGLAGAISAESDSIDIVDQNLTLEGLKLVYERNLK